MKLFVEASPRLPIVSIAIAFRSGSTFDPAGKEGLCRTTARMLRRGCAGWGQLAPRHTQAGRRATVTLF